MLQHEKQLNNFISAALTGLLASGKTPDHITIRKAISLGHVVMDEKSGMGNPKDRALGHYHRLHDFLIGLIRSGELHELSNGSNHYQTLMKFLEQAPKSVVPGYASFDLSDRRDGEQVFGLVLDEAEGATVLAALRYWQEKGMAKPQRAVGRLHRIASSEGAVTSLDDSAIDELCQKINADSNSAEGPDRKFPPYDECPKCGSADIEQRNLPYTDEGPDGVACCNQTMTCLSCHAEWVEHFRLHSISYVREGDKSGPDGVNEGRGTYKTFYAELVADLVESRGYAYECRHGHPNCSLRQGGHCADETERKREQKVGEEKGFYNLTLDRREAVICTYSVDLTDEQAEAIRGMDERQLDDWLYEKEQIGMDWNETACSPEGALDCITDVKVRRYEQNERGGFTSEEEQTLEEFGARRLEASRIVQAIDALFAESEESNYVDSGDMLDLLKGARALLVRPEVVK